MALSKPPKLKVAGSTPARGAKKLIEYIVATEKICAEKMQKQTLFILNRKSGSQITNIAILEEKKSRIH